MNKYNLDAGKTSIDRASLSPELEKELKSRGYRSLESIYGLYLGCPDLAEKWILPFIAPSEFKEWIKTIKSLIPKETSELLEKMSKEKVRYHGGFRLDT